MRLRIDPWDPEYGPSIDLNEDLADPTGLDLSVEEPGEWSPEPAPAVREDIRCAFVDGVRRIDARLFAEGERADAPGLCGSWAAGCALTASPARVGTVDVGRALVVGAGLAPPALELQVGRQRMRYVPRSVPGEGLLDPVHGLQNEMRAAEARIAAAALDAGDVDLVVSDGPLTYFTTGPLIGLVKRQSRPYLDRVRARVIPRLRPGERSPIFAIGGHGRERYSWYLRLADARPIDGAAVGVVRLEVAATDGLESTQALAGLAAAILPRFATRAGRDPRAPQQLYPIAALEGTLRHRLGDQTLIRRAIEARLLAGVPHA